jgi:hypothetical protein
MADRIGAYMSDSHTKFIGGATPSKLEKLENGKIMVTLMQEGEEI